MKRFGKWLLTPLFVVMATVLVAFGAHAATRTIYEILTDFNTAANNFIDFAQDETIVGQDFIEQYPLKAQALESKIDDVKTELAGASATDTSGPSTSAVSSTLTRMKSALADSRAALTAGDETAFEAALQRFDAASSDYTAEVNAFNKKATGFTVDEQTWLYGALFGATILLGVGTLAWKMSADNKSKLSPHFSPSQELELKKKRGGILLASIWPMVGAGITLGTFLFTTNGTYYILWGPIAFGVALYIRSIVDYRRARKHAPATAAAPTIQTPPATPPTQAPPSFPA